MPILKAHFEGYFNGGGAVVGEKDFCLIGWQDGEYLFGELYGRLVREAGKDNVFEGQCLLVYAAGNMGVCVPVYVHPPRGDAIYVFVALLVVEKCAFAAYNSYGRKGAFGMCKWVPNNGLVAFLEVAHRRGVVVFCTIRWQ